MLSVTPKTTGPAARNGSIWPAKRSAMISLTMRKASGLPAYRSIKRAFSSSGPPHLFLCENRSPALRSNPPRRKVRMKAYRLSSRRTGAACSRLVSSRQL